jgi:hypothetical protein
MGLLAEDHLCWGNNSVAKVDGPLTKVSAILENCVRCCDNTTYESFKLTPRNNSRINSNTCSLKSIVNGLNGCRC